MCLVRCHGSRPRPRRGQKWKWRGAVLPAVSLSTLRLVAIVVVFLVVVVVAVVVVVPAVSWAAPGGSSSCYLGFQAQGRSTSVSRAVRHTTARSGQGGADHCGPVDALVRRLEEEYLQAYTEDVKVPGWRAGNQGLFEVRSYGHEKTASRAAASKSFTNQAVAAAAEQATQAAGASMAQQRALVLDGMEGNTTQALLRVGFSASQILAPNVDPAVAASLRGQHGASAWAGKVESYLRAHAEMKLPALRLVYLDHTGSVPRHVSLLRKAVASGAVGSGSVVAASFSTKRGPRKLPRSWSPAHALHAVVDVLVRSGAARGLIVEGMAMPGLRDSQRG
ncbi:unnamed protein product [Polarella glacialis]|uniref:Uncharacterized protein n=1 Tax=Polarella glacialis TaxID=89957 RepID=A0A813FNY7_POLGL|nr:unnamed protein product [Polarella glacialis]